MKQKKESIINLEEVNALFENDILLSDLDKYTFLKLIIHCLGQCIQDKNGEPPQFTLNNNFVFMEIEDLRFTVEVRDNNNYS